MSVHSCTRRACRRTLTSKLGAFLVLGVIVCTLGLAAPAHAQDSGESTTETTVEPTEEQARLNDQGVRAISEEDYVKAISLLEEAKYLGELNITYLNLGRAYQLAGRCEKAREALEKVEDAPKVEKPPAGLIESKAQEYLSVLESTCDAPGESAKSEPEPTEPAPTSPPPPASTTSTRPAGIAMTSAGAAVMLGAVGMHFLWAESIRDDATSGLSRSSDGVVLNTSQREFYDARDRANNIDTAALITGVAGGVVTGVGLYFWLSDTGTESASRLQLTPSTDGVRATWTVNF